MLVAAIGALGCLTGDTVADLESGSELGMGTNGKMNTAILHIHHILTVMRTAVLMGRCKLKSFVH